GRRSTTPAGWKSRGGAGCGPGRGWYGRGSPGAARPEDLLRRRPLAEPLGPGRVARLAAQPARLAGRGRARAGPVRVRLPRVQPSSRPRGAGAARLHAGAPAPAGGGIARPGPPRALGAPPGPVL